MRGESGTLCKYYAATVSLLSVFARSESVYDMHFVPLRAVFLHQGSWKGHSLPSTGCSASGTWTHIQHERYYGLGMDGLVMGGNGMLSNMNFVMVWAWMF